MYLLRRAWLRLTGVDMLGAAVWIMRKCGVVYEAESLVHLEVINALSKVLGAGNPETVTTHPHQVEAHWYLKPGCYNALYELAEAEASRLHRSIDGYRLDEIDHFIAWVKNEQKKRRRRLKLHLPRGH